MRLINCPRGDSIIDSVGAMYSMRAAANIN